MPTFPTADPAVLARLRHYDAPTICNVIELLGIRPRTAGYTDARVRACFPKMAPMVGYATTATFRAGSPPRAGDVYAGLVRQVELIAASPGPAVVVFQDLDDPCVAATFGEVMCTTYKAFGCVGLVTSGAGRDLEQVELLDFPCFTGGAICSHGYSQIAQLDVPVRVGGITIHPGDLVHGDRNGITTIPTELASIVAGACPELMEAEAVVLNYLKAGKPDPTGFAEARAETHRRIEALGGRLRQLVSRPSGAG
jgi:regulator of RNase E activity RraA